MSEISPRTCRSARRLRYAARAGIAVLALAILLCAWVLATGQLQIASRAIRVEGGGLSPRAAAAVLGAMAILLILALLRLDRMLRTVEGGLPFGTSGDLRGFALFLFLAVLASILLPPLIHLALGAAGGRAATLSLSGDQALALLVTGLLFLVARLLDEAQRLADDHSQIV